MTALRSFQSKCEDDPLGWATTVSERMNRASFTLDDLPPYSRVLLLQGPVGPFFRRIAGLLEQNGTHVTKINFNGGDDWFYRKGDIIRFSAKLEQWETFFARLISENKYDALFLFGDCRRIHRTAKEIASASDCAVWVFEEGYYRPNYITLERDGVNAFSPIANLAMDQLRGKPLLQIPENVEFPNSFRKMAWQAFVYFFFVWLGERHYPHYTHHKPTGATEGFRWLLSGLRKGLYNLSESATRSLLFSLERKQRFFVFPLQVHNDAQLDSHSNGCLIRHHLTQVVTSFAKYANKEDWLVIKHHPMDRGHRNYWKIISALTSELGLAGRLHYIHDVHLPSLLDRCKGVVTVNSTTGLQALDHDLPVVTLGRAFYNKPDLTYQGPIDTFWTTTWKPDRALYLQFRGWTIVNTQINSSFYADPTCGSRTALTPTTRANPRFYTGRLNGQSLLLGARLSPVKINNHSV